MSHGVREKGWKLIIGSLFIGSLFIFIYLIDKVQSFICAFIALIVIGA